MPCFFLQACPRYFSLCPHPDLSPSLASVLLEHRTLCLQRKKKHFVMSYLCCVQDSDEQATAYWFTGLTYCLRSPAPKAPAPSTQRNIFCLNTQSFAHNLLSNPFVTQRKRSLISFLIGQAYALVFFSYQTPNTKSCLFDQTAWTACYFCSAGTKLAPRALSHRQPQLLHVEKDSLL